MPIDQSREVHIGSGDEYNSFVDNYGHVTIIKMTSGVAKSILKGVKVDKRFSDDTSLQSDIAENAVITSKQSSGEKNG